MERNLTVSGSSDDHPSGKKRVAQTLERGLKVLRFLNEYNGTSVAEISTGTGINRVIAHRLVETLAKAGYVQKREGEHRFYLTSSVKALADGYVGESWISEIAQPIVKSLGERTVWPVSLATCDGGEMIIRINSDSDSPLARRRIPTGYRLNMLDSASGLAYLAYCSPSQRHAIISLQDGTMNYGNGPVSDAVLSDAQRWNGFRKDGYVLRHNEAVRVTHLAVPLISHDTPIATMTLRVFDSAMPASRAVSEYLSALKSSAATISSALSSEAEINTSV